MIEDPPLYLRRGAVVRWLSALGISGYSVRIMFEDGTILAMPKTRAGLRALYSREQIRRDVISKFIEAEATGCDTSHTGAKSANAEAREVKAKSK